MSFFTDGQGTPWGATSYGLPQTPNLITDPYKVPGIDQTGLQQAMLARLGQQTGRQQESGQAMLSKAGIYDSSQQSGLSRDIADQASQAQAGMQAQLAQQDYQNRLGLMNENNSNAIGMYGIGSQNYNQEQSNRNQFWGGLLGSAGQLGGMYMASRNMPWGQQQQQNQDVNTQVPQFNWSPNF